MPTNLNRIVRTKDDPPPTTPAAEPVYPARRVLTISVVGTLAVYAIVVSILLAVGVATTISIVVAFAAQMTVGTAYNRRILRKHRAAWDAWFAAEYERRGAERVAAFDAHVRTLNIFNQKPQG